MTPAEVHACEFFKAVLAEYAAAGHAAWAEGWKLEKLFTNGGWALSHDPSGVSIAAGWCPWCGLNLMKSSARRDYAEAFPYSYNFMPVSVQTVFQIQRENAVLCRWLGLPQNDSGLKKDLLGRNKEMKRALIARRKEEWFPRFQNELILLHSGFRESNRRHSKDRARIRRAKNEPAT